MPFQIRYFSDSSLNSISIADAETASEAHQLAKKPKISLNYDLAVVEAISGSRDHQTVEIFRRQ